jgi:hypothetical protein
MSRVIEIPAFFDDKGFEQFALTLFCWSDYRSDAV